MKGLSFFLSLFLDICEKRERESLSAVSNRYLLLPTRLCIFYFVHLSTCLYPNMNFNANKHLLVTAGKAQLSKIKCTNNSWLFEQTQNPETKAAKCNSAVTSCIVSFSIYHFPTVIGCYDIAAAPS